MLFHTWPFLMFLVVVLPVFFGLRKTRLWLPWLTLSSYFFYGWWNPYYLLLVAYSTLLDFTLVALMDHTPAAGSSGGFWARLTRLKFEEPVMKAAFLVSFGAFLGSLTIAAGGPRTVRPVMTALAILLLFMGLGALSSSRKIWLLISVLNNLSVLLFFKYARFVTETLNALLASVHLPARLADPSTLMPSGFPYLLPVGISFFTFQSLSYTIDFYRGNAARERSLLRFATFVCFFPQLMAGPIERARHLLPQFERFPPFQWQNITDGASLFLLGLFKKLVLANYLGLYVDRVFDNPAVFDGASLFLATVAFGWQIYFDFSGYTDMARGVARFMGFNLVLNFNHPYVAVSLREFWSRWHISLSSWFRDYVYIPLGGNRGGPLLTWRNLLLTFLIAGVWHGANWTFVIWGVLHGLGVAVTHVLDHSRFYTEQIPKWFKRIGVFLFVSLCWVFFRCDSVADALLILRRIFVAGWRAPQAPVLLILMIAVAWAFQYLCESRFKRLATAGTVRVGMAVAILIALCVCAAGGQAFIYFQF